ASPSVPVVPAGGTTSTLLPVVPAGGTTSTLLPVVPAGGHDAALRPGGTLETMTAFDQLALPDFPHAVVVTDAAGTRLTHGETRRSFPWASVTKLLTAAATLVAVSRHLVDLDDAAGPEGATVRHLLAH